MMRIEDISQYRDGLHDESRKLKVKRVERVKKVNKDSKDEKNKENKENAKVSKKDSQRMKIEDAYEREASRAKNLLQYRKLNEKDSENEEER